MELGDAITKRRMTRRFLADPIPPQILDEVLAAVLGAPSAGFTQGVDLVVLSTAARRERFWELSTEAEWRTSPAAIGLLAAPVIVVPVLDGAAYSARYAEADKASSRLAGVASSDWDVPYPIVDAAFATMLLLLAAEGAGLGALFFQLHRDSATVLAGLGIPVGRDTIGAVALGYRATSATATHRRERRPVSDRIHRELW